MDMHKARWLALTTLSGSMLLFAACQASPTTTAPQATRTAETDAPTKPAPASETSMVATMPSTEAPESGPASPLPAVPQEVTFQAADGQELHGLYYPAEVNPAPLVVLVHWVRSDQSDWIDIALWQQGRFQVPFADVLPSLHAMIGDSAQDRSAGPWRDPTWFPAMPEDRSYGVFTFSYRGCEASGCSAWDPQGWLLDAQAALQTAVTLSGVDTDRVATIGASIGADGAIDGCLWLNQQTDVGRCTGALSLSPGGYLDMPYEVAVSDLISLATAQEPDAKLAILCLASDGDPESAPTCRAASGAGYEMIMHPGSAHGMELIDPATEPNTLTVVLDFLERVFGD